MATTTDPVTREIIRAALNAAAEEMKLNLIRTAYSTLIYEVLDFAVGVFDATGRTLAQALGLPLFLGNLGAAIQDALDTYGRDGLRPGDVIVTNDPYTTGTHLGDVSVTAPIFHEGQLVAFAASRGHLLDIGGKAPGGGWYFDTTDVYQEGIRLKSLKLFKAGEPNDDVRAFIRYNSRFADIVLGDLDAQVAACRTGAARLGELFAKVGLDRMRAYVEEIMDYNERLARVAVSRIPDGEYRASAFLDNDGVELDRHVPLEVRVEVAGDGMTIDFSMVPPMAKGPINCGASAAHSAARVAFVSLTGPFTNVNEGNFRPLAVVVPPGRIVSALEPAPVAAYGLALVVLVDLVYKALSEAIPDRVAAGHYGSISSIVLHGRDTHGRRFIHIEGIQGGWGGRAFEDGESVVTSLTNGDTRNVPIEVLEAKCPVLVEKYELRQDSGGAGRFRGGLGYERVHRILQEGTHVNVFFERTQCAPWGLFGGRAAAANRCFVDAADGRRSDLVLKAVARPLSPGDRIRMLTGGGGGYGNPAERDAERVRLDVVRGYVSPEAARRDYGVVVDPDSFQVDVDGTARERAGRGSSGPRGEEMEVSQVSLLRIGNVEAVRGKAVRGLLRVATRPGGAPVEVPFFVLCGRENGPVLLVDACNHGSEYEGPPAVLRLVRELDPQALRGTLVAVPVVNLPAFEEGRRSSSIDGININRIWPGSRDGTITQRIAWTYFQEVVVKAQYIVTLHSGGRECQHPPLVAYQDEGDAIGAKALSLARVFGTELLARWTPFDGALVKETSRLGIVTINPEAGGVDRGVGTFRANVQVFVDGTINVMKQLGMLDGDPVLPPRQRVAHIVARPPLSYVQLADGGIFWPEAELGAEVGKGTVLGRLTDLHGDEIQIVTAPFDCIVIGLHTDALGMPGEFAALLGEHERTFENV